MGRFSDLTDDEKAHIVYALDYMYEHGVWPSGKPTFFGALSFRLRRSKSVQRGLKKRGWLL